MGPSRLSFGTRAGHPYDYNRTSQQASIATDHFRTNPTAPLHQSSVDELVTTLHQGLEQAHNDGGETPECSVFAFVLDSDTVVKLIRPSTGPYAAGGPQDLPDEFKLVSDTAAGDAGGDYEDGQEKRYPEVTVAAVLGIEDDKTRSIVQRAASRGLIAAVEDVDGFRYTFNNAWAAKDEEGQRFSYICQDSMQNKDRHANGYLRAVKNAKLPVSENEAARGARKPTYDCKGAVSVKFSRTRGLAEVFYRHFAIHKTVAERRPGGRTRKSDYIRVKDRTVEGIRTHAALRKYQKQLANGGGSSEDEGQDGGGESAVSHSAPGSTAANVSRKRKRGSSASVAAEKDTAQPMSLAAMLNAEVMHGRPIYTNDAFERPNERPAPVQWDLPPWQKPPTPPQPTPQPTQNRQQGPKQAFPPPYNSNSNKVPIPPAPASTASNRPIPPPTQTYYSPFSQPHPQQRLPNGYTPQPPPPTNYALPPTNHSPWAPPSQPNNLTQTMNGVAGPVQGRYRLEPLRRGPRLTNSKPTPPAAAAASKRKSPAPLPYGSPYASRAGAGAGSTATATSGAERRKEEGLADWEEALRAGARAELSREASPDPWFPKR
ncbi:hypothetical protein MBLNU230_g0996t1 [Neophaeotheca triangularis]